MFDLPVVEANERRLASRFRQDLLDVGYFMLQESVYVRNCVSYEKYQQHLSKVQALAPQRGSITARYITEKQWLSSVNMTLVKPKRGEYQTEAGEGRPEQMTFW